MEKTLHFQKLICMMGIVFLWWTNWQLWWFLSSWVCSRWFRCGSCEKPDFYILQVHKYPYFIFIFWEKATPIICKTTTRMVNEPSKALHHSNCHCWIIPGADCIFLPACTHLKAGRDLASRRRPRKNHKNPSPWNNKTIITKRPAQRNFPEKKQLDFSYNGEEIVFMQSNDRLVNCLKLM